jgi:hypothetical protein
MNTLRQAAQQALEAHKMLRDWIKAVPQEVALPAMPGIDGDWLDEVESNLCAALEQPEQGPVAECVDDGEGGVYYKTLAPAAPIGMLYTTPQPRLRVGLTASTILNMMPSSIPAEHDGALMEFARDIEAKLKERNT